MKRVLVVDDANFMINLLSNMFTEMGYEVVGSAGDGMEGFEKYKKLNPDIVTMDITMPNYSGIDGLKMIKDYDPKAKVIMCSAMGQQSYVLESLKLGAIDFIIKPFNKERVLESVNKIS